MAFDPDAYLKGNGGFNPDAYLAGGSSTQAKSPSLAESVVSAISPEAPQSQGGSFLTRLAQGTKEIFVPSMEGIKRLFNPNAGQFGPPRVLEQTGQQVGAAVRGAGQNIAENIATSKFGQQNPNTAAALGAGISTAADVTSGGLTPTAFQQQLGAEGLGAAARPEMKALSKELSQISDKAAASGFGFNKSVLNKVKGGAERAATASGEMVDRGAMGAFTSPETMKARVEAIQSEAGNAMGQIQKSIDATGATPIDAGKISNEIYDQLMPKAEGGIADKMRSAVQNVVDTVRGYGHGPVTFEQMRELKDLVNPGKWGDAQMAAMGEDAQKIFQIRQRASAIIGKAMDDAVEASVPKEQFSSYQQAKDVYGKSSEVLKAVTDKTDRVAGRRFLDLPASIAGAGGLSYAAITGNPVIAAKVLLAIGAEKFIQTFGAQQFALASKAASGALAAGIPAGAGTGFSSILKNYIAKNTPASQQTQAPSMDFTGLVRRAGQNLVSPGTKTASAEPIPRSTSLPSLPADQKAVAEGLTALMDNNIEGAKKAWLKAVRLNPGNLDARRGLERIAIKEGKNIDFYKQKRGRK